MTKRAQLLSIVCVGTLLLPGGARGAEKAEFKGSTSVELPKPRRTVDDLRQMNTGPSKPDIEGGSVAPPPMENSPLINRKIREELDRKKNWIFMNPNEDNFDRKTAEFMKGEKGTGLYDNRLMQDEEKTAVEKFLQEKDTNRDSTRDDSRKERESSSKESLAEKGRSLKDNREDEESEKEKTTAFGPAKAKFDTATFGTKGSDPFAPGSDKFEKNPLSENPFRPKSGPAFDRDELRQRQLAHGREFDQLLQAKPGSAAALGKVDILNPAADIGRLDLSGGASGSRRPDALFPGNRPAQGGNTAVFTDGGFGGGKIDVGRSLGNDNLGALPTKPVSPFSAAPSVTAPTPNAGFSPAPFVLPFPQRKF